MTQVLERGQDLLEPAAEQGDVDVLFVGAGASTAYTLLGLVDGLAARPPARPLRIAVVEREGDAFAGVPYGVRAARTALLITALRDFLPDEERRLFAEWLGQNKDWIFDEFLSASGALGGRWWARHRAEVAAGDFDPLFLPRYVFGTYLTGRTRAALARARATGLAGTEVIQDEVLSIAAHAGGYAVQCRENRLQARAVVLAVGSAPTLSRLHAAGAELPAVLLDRPFDAAGMDVDRIRDGLQRVPAGRRPHVVLLGGNASTMDLLFQINDLRVPAAERARFTVLSLRGQLPDRLSPTPPAETFVPENLARLEEQEGVWAVELYQAARADIVAGRRAGLGAGDTLPAVSAALGRLLPKLSPRQTAEFAERWGVELGRHQRRAGWEYYEVIDALRAADRLGTVAGAFVGLTPAEAGGVLVHYEVHRGRDRWTETLAEPADVVVNCAGPARDLRQAGHPLLDQLISSGVCRVTPSGTGIAVDSTFAAGPRFYVMGPLLAGNVVGGRPIWHMEHCGRISAYGSAVGAGLAERLGTAQPAGAKGGS